MRIAFALVLAAILYLSLFPGRFDWSRPFTLWPPFHPILYRSDVIDVIVNVPFYVPLGFTAVAAWARQRNTLAILLATMFGTAVSYGVELAQEFIVPRRFSNSRDILFNAIGAALGAWMATQPRWRNFRPKWSVAWWFLALWWTWLAFPFYPNLRYVQVARMWEHSHEEFAGLGLSLVVAGAHFAGGAVMASLSKRRRWLPPLLALAAVFQMTFVYGLRFSPLRVAATLAGFAVAQWWIRRPGWLAIIVCGWAAVYVFYYGAPGLAPYDTTWEVAPDAARASWRTPVRDVAGKLFLASAVVWSVWRMRRG